MLTYAAASGPVIPDHLPPLVSFELDIWTNYHEWDESMLSLPSLCTRVAGSLTNLSLPSMNLNSSELQYIGEHLPLLEVLQFRCVVYIAFQNYYYSNYYCNTIILALSLTDWSWLQDLICSVALALRFAIVRPAASRRLTSDLYWCVCASVPLAVRRASPEDAPRH